MEQENVPEPETVAEDSAGDSLQNQSSLKQIDQAGGKKTVLISDTPDETPYTSQLAELCVESLRESQHNMKMTPSEFADETSTTEPEQISIFKDNEGSTTDFRRTGFTYSRFLEPFKENIYRTRPAFFPENWLQKDLVLSRKDFAHYSEKLVKSLADRRVATIISEENNIFTSCKSLDVRNAPMSAVKVQWRIRSHGTIKLESVYLMLNRYGKVKCLGRISQNSAISVFTTIEGADRCISAMTLYQISKLLILQWWHPMCARYEFRSRFSQNDILSQNHCWIRWNMSNRLIGPSLESNICVDKELLRRESFSKQLGDDAEEEEEIDSENIMYRSKPVAAATIMRKHYKSRKKEIRNFMDKYKSAYF